MTMMMLLLLIKKCEDEVRKRGGVKKSVYGDSTLCDEVFIYIEREMIKCIDSLFAI
jgi:hypothetical protein